MSSYTNYSPPLNAPSPRGRPTGGKRGRKPRIATDGGSVAGPSSASTPTQATATPIPWAQSTTASAAPGTPAPAVTSAADSQVVGSSTDLLSIPGVAVPVDDGSTNVAVNGASVNAVPRAVREEEEEPGEDDLLPAMADDDYSAQLSFQSQSKDNLKVLMENLSSAQYDRFEAYRRHALPKQAVRRVIQQTTGQQVSQPIAQIVAGFAKVFVGEIVEKARKVQRRRGEVGPLSPDHLREAYRDYQQETGRVGSARSLRGKRLFVR